MPINKADGLLLKAFNWAESSRTLVFFTRERGLLTLTDKGGRTLMSKRGRAIPFARLALTYYSSEKEAPGYVSTISVEEAWRLEDGDLAIGKVTFGATACELLRLILPPEEPHWDVFDLTTRYFGAIARAPRTGLYPVFICYLLRAMSLLGYRPSLTGCVSCGRGFENDAGEGRIFSSERGGLVCSLCRTAGERYIVLSGEEVAVAAHLQASSLDESLGMTLSQDRAARLIEALIGFLRAQTGIGKINSLDFLDKIKKAHGA